MVSPPSNKAQGEGYKAQGYEKNLLFKCLVFSYQCITAIQMHCFINRIIGVQNKLNLSLCIFKRLFFHNVHNRFQFRFPFLSIEKRDPRTLENRFWTSMK